MKTRIAVAFGLLALLVFVACITCAAYDPNWKKSDCDIYSYHGLGERYVYGGDKGWIDNNVWDSSSTEGVDCSDYVPRCLALPNYVGEHTPSGHPYSTASMYPGIPNTYRLPDVNSMQQWDFWVWQGHTGLFKQYSGSNIITREARGSAYGVVEMTRSKQSLIDQGTRYYRRNNWGSDVVIVNPPYYFNSDNMGWFPGGGVPAIGWAGGSWPGVMWFDQIGNDGNVISPNTSFIGSSNEVISVRVYPQGGTTASHDMNLYWKIADEPYFDEAKSTPVVNYTAQDYWVTIPLNVNNPKWIGKTITQLRLDVDSTNHGTRFIIDSITRQSAPQDGPGSDSPDANRTDVFTRGFEGSLWQRTWTSGGGWSGLTNLGGYLYDSPAVLWRDNNNLDVFLRGGDNGLWVKEYSTSQGWYGDYSLGGVCTSAPAACARDANSREVVVRGGDNAIWLYSWNSSQGWFQNYSLGGNCISGPAICARDTNHLDVFAVGTDGQLWGKNWTNGVGWGDWYGLGLTCISDPAVCSRTPTTIDVFVQGPDNAIWSRHYDASTNWQGAYSIGGICTSKPSVTTRGANSMEVFVRGTNNHLYQNSWASNYWSGWVDQGSYY